MLTKVYEKNGLGQETRVFYYKSNGVVLGRGCTDTRTVIRHRNGKETTEEIKPFFSFNSNAFDKNAPFGTKEFYKWMDLPYEERAKGLPYEEDIKQIIAEFKALGVDRFNEYTAVYI